MSTLNSSKIGFIFTRGICFNYRIFLLFICIKNHPTRPLGDIMQGFSCKKKFPANYVIVASQLVITYEAFNDRFKF